MKLVFIHGSGARGDVWMLQKRHFTDADTPDLPGHPHGEICTSIEAYSDWLHGYFQKKEYTDVVLAGHSLGGGIALMHAVRYPKDLKGIIMIGSGARLRVLPLILEAIEAKLGDTHGWITELVEPLYGTVEEKTRRAIMPGLAEVGPAAQLNDFRCCDKFDFMGRVNEVKLPVLCIVGDQDNMTPPKYSQYLAGKMPDCRVSIIEGGTHLAFLEKPAEVNRAIESFLKQIAT
ncbi:MAG: alpha/beta hydrolase [Dehalococcoidia bacterium]